MKSRRRVNSTVMLLRLSLVIVLLTLSCSRSHVGSDASQQSTALPSPAPKIEVIPSPTPVQPIRQVDFNNVAFPKYPEYTDRGRKYLTLKPGDGGPAMLNYGDVTGDGVEEALMMLGIESHGSAIPEIVYIFGLENGKQKVLWSFETGDRADGGFRNAYADHGDLVVELFGNDRIIGSNLYRGEEGLCCPSSFTRARYGWNGTKFRLKGPPEVLPNPNGGANPVMPIYDGPSK
jgi:hypothetical protein